MVGIDTTFHGSKPTSSQHPPYEGPSCLRIPNFCSAAVIFLTPRCVMPISDAIDSVVANLFNPTIVNTLIMFFSPSERIPVGSTACAHATICSLDGELSCPDGALSMSLGVLSDKVGTLSPGLSSLLFLSSLAVNRCELPIGEVALPTSFAYLVNPTETQKDPICAVSKDGSPLPLSISSTLTRPMPRPKRFTYPSVRMASAIIGLR